MKRSLIQCLALAAVALPVVTFAKMAAPSTVPVKRLIQNVELRLKSQPKDPELIFTLARLHGLGYAAATKETQVYWSERTAEGTNQNGGFHFAPWVSIQKDRESKEKTLNEKELGHLRQSFNLYGKALELTPDNSYAKLGRGWICEEAAKYSGQTSGFIPGKRMSKADFVGLAAKYYRELVAAYKSKPNEHRWGREDEEPAYEAAENLLQMFSKGFTAKPGEPAALNALMKDFEQRPLVMSPIIFPVAGAAPADLITTGTTTNFDIAADGIKRNWEWITPKAAFLAWDPAGTGKITSGEQLFGNRTFNMFFTDGYAALASLDDNADGWLTKREINGIVVWHDRNSNGISDPGEVTPVATWGVEAIRVKSNTTNTGMLEATVGLRFTGGRTSPTYDWWPSSK